MWWQGLVQKQNTELWPWKCELLWIKMILEDLRIKWEGLIKLQCDNKSTINIAHNMVQHDRTKHIEVDKYFMKEKLDSGLICIDHVSSKDQLIDILTKGLDNSILLGLIIKMRMTYISFVAASDPASEYWNQEEEEDSNEDISESEDEALVLECSAKSKISSKATLDEKFEALQRAEESYYQNKGQKKQVKFGLSGRNIISEALREACKERLSNALNQAKERLRNQSLDIDSSSTSLELDCFKKYENVGKTFYNSQIAATVRWLSSASYEQISERLSRNSSSHDAENKPIVFESAATSSSLSPANQILFQSVKEDQFMAKILEKNVYEPAAVDLSHGKVDLPPIPSFSEFVYQKANNPNRPPMGSESAPKRIAEADERKQRVHVHKKMKQ
ncbi:hypothetical protein KFK09_022264 [Dendrobium nobile]|uniref:Uncharacterized protein n=1 Tax=Dendrobium nobile TaxID=94219 RepID=A0A8T3AI31_DENNO|nr:hypothetical protein KFK09_022264 [Dendrobium nobile]